MFQPNNEFFEKLKIMEKLFLCHYRENGLKPGKGTIKMLAADMSKLVSLPIDVISFFIRCRMFFRMRELYKNIISSRKHSKK